MALWGRDGSGMMGAEVEIRGTDGIIAASMRPLALYTVRRGKCRVFKGGGLEWSTNERQISVAVTGCAGSVFFYSLVRIKTIC